MIAAIKKLRNYITQELQQGNTITAEHLEWIQNKIDELQVMNRHYRAIAAFLAGMGFTIAFFIIAFNHITLEHMPKLMIFNGVLVIFVSMAALIYAWRR